MAELAKLETLFQKFGLSKTPDGYEPLKDEDLEALATQMDAAALRKLADQVEEKMSQRDAWWRAVGVSTLVVGLFAGAFATLFFLLAPAYETNVHVMTTN